MGLTARKKGGGDFEPIPAGPTIASCFAVYDLGTHFDAKWDKRQHKVLLMWECPEYRIDYERKDGQKVNAPRAISNRYTLSLHEKAELRKMLESWRGRQFTEKELEGFDLKNVLGKACLINVVHGTNAKGDKTYANIGAIMPVPRGTIVPAMENPPRFFSFEEPGDLPAECPEWVAEIITASDEWKAQSTPDKGTAGDVPATGTLSYDQAIALVESRGMAEQDLLSYLGSCGVQAWTPHTEAQCSELTRTFAAGAGGPPEDDIPFVHPFTSDGAPLGFVRNDLSGRRVL